MRQYKKRTLSPRWPLAPMMVATSTHSLTELARALEMDDSQLHRWERDGGIPDRSADRLACRLGLHPLNIWPEMYDNV